ncbi:polycomb protein EED [Vigna unguiculata]|uniref:Polycomb protein EED n=1 Tax=Vigna unguiculata TaxID=3917 RepID=A0A4D6LGV8_VIGUN|nr:polycomb protein EED [Vigna unguiculata]
MSFLVDWLRLDIRICNWWTDVRLDALNEEYHLEVFLPLNDHKNNTKRGTISWACNVDGTPFVGAGGINKVIPVVEVGNEKIHKQSTTLAGLICPSINEAPDIGSGVPSPHEILGSSGGSQTP